MREAGGEGVARADGVGDAWLMKAAVLGLLVGGDEQAPRVAARDGDERDAE